MGKWHWVATIKTVPGKREEHLTAHAQRCLATEPRYLEVRDTPAPGGDRHGQVRGLGKPGRLRSTPEAHWNGPSKQRYDCCRRGSVMKI